MSLKEKETKMKIVIGFLLYIFLISCKNTPLTVLCQISIICDPNKEGECATAYKEAQKSCESKK